MSKMKRICSAGRWLKALIILASATLAFCSCASNCENGRGKEQTKADTQAQTEKQVTEDERVERELTVKVDGEKIPVEWEKNDAVEGLRDLAAEGPITVSMSKYGGFEQVGALGADLPSNDVRITTSAGDIVLYSGDQIVMFYGSNTWAYTRLGRISGLSVGEIENLLGNADVTVTISLD